MLSAAAQKHASSGTVGAIVTTVLDDERCLVPSLVAWPVTALAQARRHFEVTDTVVVVIPRRALGAASPAAPLVAARLNGPVNIRGWLAEPSGEAIDVGPSFYNVDPAGAGEAIVELAAIAGRDEDPSRYGRLVVTCQQFVPGRASARVRVCGRSGEVTIRSCWGLHESLDAVFDHDLLVLSLPSVDVRSHVVAVKPTAVCPANGGTHMVPVEPARRHEATVDRDLGRQLAVRCWSLTKQYARDAEFDVAIVDETSFLLTCRPLTAA